MKTKIKNFEELQKIIKLGRNYLPVGFFITLLIFFYLIVNNYIKPQIIYTIEVLKMLFYVFFIFSIVIIFNTKQIAKKIMNFSKKDNCWEKYWFFTEVIMFCIDIPLILGLLLIFWGLNPNFLFVFFCVYLFSHFYNFPNSKDLENFKKENEVNKIK